MTSLVLCDVFSRGFEFWPTDIEGPYSSLCFYRSLTVPINQNHSMGELWFILGTRTRQDHLLGVPPTFALPLRLCGLDIAQIKVPDSFQAGN